MTPKKELQVATWLAAILLVVSVISYAAAPVKTPDEPVRIMFNVVAGNVLFDHKTHTDSSGYGLSCKDCHHHPEEDDTDLRACGDCHRLPEKDEAVQEACTDCHDPDEIEGSEMMKRPDAFHAQCIDCHKEAESGPQDCGLCHFMQ